MFEKELFLTPKLSDKTKNDIDLPNHIVTLDTCFLAIKIL